MPRTETILSIFVASPSDVAEERDILERIVGSVNASLAGALGCRLELIRWERDVSPGFGADPQAVINSQIPSEIDVFVGILWHRIGSPTNRAESGTIEEFELAKSRYDEDPKSIRLMIYFKEEPPLSMSEIDPEQYKKVRDFRSRISNEGGLYTTFSSSEDFAHQVQIHLTKHVAEWSQQNNGPPPDESGDPYPASVSTSMDLLDNSIDLVNSVNAKLDSEFLNLDDPNEDSVEEGILDLEDVVEEEFLAVSDILHIMTGAIVDVGKNISGRTSALQALKPKDETIILSPRELKSIRARMKRVMNDASADMNEFSARMSTELPLYEHHLYSGLGAFSKAVPIYLEMNQDRTELKLHLTELLASIDGMQDGLEGLHETIHDLPRATTAFAKSRKQMERVLQEVIDITNAAKTSLDSALGLLP